MFKSIRRTIVATATALALGLGVAVWARSAHYLFVTTVQPGVGHVL